MEEDRRDTTEMLTVAFFFVFFASVAGKFEFDSFSLPWKPTHRRASFRSRPVFCISISFSVARFFFVDYSLFFPFVGRGYLEECFAIVTSFVSVSLFSSTFCLPDFELLAFLAAEMGRDSTNANV